jgi:recombination protein RecR
LTGGALETLIQILARLPGLGPRSARRAALQLVKRRETALLPLAAALEEVARTVRGCRLCGNLCEAELCEICADPERDPTQLCVVEDVEDLWALERSGAFKGRYHVLGGTLSALDGIGPEKLAIGPLLSRLREGHIKEVILALGATVDGQTTAHYVADRLSAVPVTVTRLAHGVPVGGELDYLDEGTLSAAFKARRSL